MCDSLDENGITISEERGSAMTTSALKTVRKTSVRDITTPPNTGEMVSCGVLGDAEMSGSSLMSVRLVKSGLGDDPPDS